ncbi:MAG: beta-phosphoglucomutase family hydrolase [Candidatus Coatesbacteria bacterium]
MPLSDWAAIFDMDGVVVDTVGLHFKAWKRVFEEHGVPFTFDDYKAKVDGIPRRDGARAILTGLDDAGIERACDIKQGYFLEMLDREKIPAYPGTVNLIKSIRGSGRKAALISSSRNLPRIIKSAGVEDIWDAIVTGTEVTKGKPDPQVFLMAAERVKMTPARCVVIEDATQGVEAAKRGGMKCIGIDRHGDPARLAKADLVVQDLGEIGLSNVEALFR